MRLTFRSFLAMLGLLILASLMAPSHSAAAIINNGGDSWARESSPGGTFEGDLLAVWSRAKLDPPSTNSMTARYGSIEFDISGETITAASLALWSEAFGFSDDDTPLKQSAAILSAGTLGDTTGIPSHPLSWNDIAAGTLHPLEGLGKYDLPPVGATPAIQDVYLHSPATANDLAALTTVAAGDGRLILVLIADEDGEVYAKSWGDGEYDGNDGFLATNGDAIPEPSTVLLLGLGLVSAAVWKYRRK